MKSKTKVISLFFLVFIAFSLLGSANVNATDYEENLISRIAPDGEITLKTVKPTNEFEAEVYLQSIANRLLNETDYKAYVSSTDNTYTNFVITITNEWGETGFQKDYNVSVIYDEPNEDRNITNTIKSFISKLKDFREIDSESYYTITDLSLINYYMNTEKSELHLNGSAGKALKYSNEIINIFNGSDVSFYLNFRAGGGNKETLYEYSFGDMTIYYKDYNYATKQQGVYLKRVIYIPQDTANSTEAYVAAAQQRINDYLGTTDVKVTYGGLLSSLEEGCEDNFISRNTTDGNYYNITIKGTTYKFYILKANEEQLKYPTYLGKNIETNIEINTDESIVPLDTYLIVRNVKGDNISQILGTENYQAFDIQLFSNSKNSYITKIENGKFLVSIPVAEELNGKDITIYYINNGTLEEHKTTIKDNIATFETDHFSTYVLAEKKVEITDNNTNNNTDTNNKQETAKQEKDETPKTGNVNYLYLAIIVATISSFMIIFRKKQK